MNLGQTSSITGDVVVGTGTAATAFGYFVNVISPVAAFVILLLAGVYYTLHILDHPLVRRWQDEKRTRRRDRKISRLQYQQKMLIGELEKLGALERAEVTPKTTTVEMKQTSDAYKKQ